MADITFKAKVRNVYNMDDTVAYRIVDMPTLTRSHCDMAAFRQHPKFSGLANSQLFPNILSRIKRETTKAGGWIRLDQLPTNVTVDESGFLAKVTITV